MAQHLDFLPDDQPKHQSPRKDITRGISVLMAGVVVVLTVIGIWLFRQSQAQPGPGSSAPDFTIGTYDGDWYTLSELRGQIVVLNFWANWCPPCHAEARDLQTIYEDYRDAGVVMLGINWLDLPGDALEFIEHYGISYPNGPDIGERIVQSYRLQGPPKTLIIGRDGVITDFFIGQVNYEIVADALETVLANDRT